MSGNTITESIVRDLNYFGTYQKWNFVFISLTVAFSCLQFCYIFNTRSTNHRCFVEECDLDSKDNEYSQSWLKDAIPREGGIFKKCERFSKNNYEYSQSKYCTAESFNKSSTQQCDKLVIAERNKTIQYDFNLICEENLWKLTILGSLGEVGKICLLPFLGYYSDIYGRKMILILSLILTSILGIVKALSPSYLVFASMEFASSAFSTAIFSSAYVFTVELLVPEERVFGTTITVLAYPVGEILVGLAAWLSPTWRITLLVLHIPGILFISYYWILDDSLCYLLAKRRFKEAYFVMKRIAKFNKIDLPENLQEHLENSNALSEMDPNIKLETESILSIFKHPKLLFRVLNCSFTWLSCTFVYFGLSVYSVSLTGNIYLNFIIMAAIELPAYILCYYILDRLGRRYTTGGSLFIGGVACLVCGFITQEYWIAQLVLSLTGKFGATIAFKTIFIYTSEMFPTTLRLTILGFCAVCGRLGSVAAPQLPLLALVSPFLPTPLFGIFGTCSGIFIFFLPETTGCKLPETLQESLNIDCKPNELK